MPASNPRRKGPIRKPASKDELQSIPGVGPSIAGDLRSIGIRRVAQLKGRSPRRLYQQLCEANGGPLDRCVLYVLRCAVYYASTPRPRADLLKWWNWKDA